MHKRDTIQLTRCRALTRTRATYQLGQVADLLLMQSQRCYCIRVALHRPAHRRVELLLQVIHLKHQVVFALLQVRDDLSTRHDRREP
jgi:hypothetical protein